MPHGLGLQMRHRLAVLAERHRRPPPTAHIEPSLPECDAAVILSGYAACWNVDLERTRFAPRSLHWISKPLLYHRHVPVPVGTITHLENTDAGLRIVATTDHQQAKCCGAFSIGASIMAYAIRDADSPDYYAEVSVAWLDEVSLTDRPANPRALVMQRMDAQPHLPSHQRVLDRIALLKHRVQTELRL